MIRSRIAWISCSALAAAVGDQIGANIVWKCLSKSFNKNYNIRIIFYSVFEQILKLEKEKVLKLEKQKVLKLEKKEEIESKSSRISRPFLSPESTHAILRKNETSPLII